MKSKPKNPADCPSLKLTLLTQCCFLDIVQDYFNNFLSEIAFNKKCVFMSF